MEREGEVELVGDADSYGEVGRGRQKEKQNKETLELQELSGRDRKTVNRGNQKRTRDKQGKYRFKGRMAE